MKDTLNAALLRFIEKAVSPFHAIAAIKEELQGYTELPEGAEWDLQPGGRYYVTRNGSAIIAFRVPEGAWQGFLLAASHSDSPTFKVKAAADMAGPENYVRINTEPYGGMIYTTWMDRPLTVAGRLLVRQGDAITAKLVYVDRDLLLIPNVAIHMNRQVNSGYAYNPKTDLVPLMGLSGGKSLSALAAEAAGVAAEDVLSADLFLCLRQKGCVWGGAGEFISAPRLDDLQCVFSTFKGFLDAKESGAMPVYCVFDNEEVGSGSRQGADGTFLRDVMERICAAMGRTLAREAAHSFMVSADNGHAVHPNHPEYADATNRPHINGGVVIKHNASQRYTTDAISDAVFSEICRRAGANVQHYYNRSDVPGGSTLGNIANSHVSLFTVDIGLAQLAMHSAYETAGAEDTMALVKAMTAYYSASLTAQGDGMLVLK